MDDATREALVQGALAVARKKGIPEDKLAKIEGIADVYDLIREHDEERKIAALNEKRKKAGLPSLRDSKAHGRIK